MIPQYNTVPKIVAGLSCSTGEWVGPRCPDHFSQDAGMEENVAAFQNQITLLICILIIPYVHFYFE